MQLERAIVEEIGDWMALYGQCIYDTRPWKIFGEAPAMEAAAIKAKTLIIVADKDVPYFIAISNYLHAHIVDSKMIFFHNNAHMLSLEQPEKFNRVLGAFLQ